ncbi:MAG: HEAT repeat domain-containing protein [Bacteroidales bacterium]
MNKKVFILCILILTVFETYASKWMPSVAVVVDKVTYQKVAPDIDAYLKSIETDGKKAILVVDKWGIPDSIRADLKGLYTTANLEGVVLVGDIPIPMIRDAQHLSTAFKMNQKRDWRDSSIPSDRFYDDFDLKFDYIKQDSTVKLYHYYSLRADSPQYISCDIYSARIKAPKIPGKDKYQAVSDYFKKVVADKAHKRQMKNILYFAGHGYNSNSLNARVDEAWALKEQFPFLNKELGTSLNFIDHTFDDFSKSRLMGALADPRVDLAILHHHGSDDTQYLNGSPKASDANTWISQTKRFFRSKVRSAKDTVASKKYYVENYDVPEDWVDGATNANVTIEDSIYDASLNINIPDFKGYSSNAKVIIIDACYNGSYHLDDYLSGHYIFNPGNTIVVKANSVNTLQDTWTNELMGLMNVGVCVGNWSKGQMTLESHLIGDPTFMFSNTLTENFDNSIVKERANLKYWKKLLNNSLPDIRALAMKMLNHNNAITSNELLKIQHNDRSAIVRLEAFMLIKKMSDANLPASIILGLSDSYELIQRMSALTAAKNQAPELLLAAAKYKLTPTTSSRVDFHIKTLIDCYNADDVKAAFETVRKEQGYWPVEENYISLIESIQINYQRDKKDFDELKNPNASFKEKRFTISAQRNKCSILFLDELLSVLTSGNDKELRLLTAETLGWYVYSYKKEYIIERCRQIADVEKDVQVKNELLKSIRRLTQN